ncbi:hypothetical protein ABC733_24635 [Mangrovibacter sp. SLW1]
MLADVPLATAPGNPGNDYGIGFLQHISFNLAAYFLHISFKCADYVNLRNEMYSQNGGNV